MWCVTGDFRGSATNERKTIFYHKISMRICSHSLPCATLVLLIILS